MRGLEPHAGVRLGARPRATVLDHSSLIGKGLRGVRSYAVQALTRGT